MNQDEQKKLRQQHQVENFRRCYGGKTPLPSPRVDTGGTPSEPELQNIPLSTDPHRLIARKGFEQLPQELRDFDWAAEERRILKEIEGND